MLDNLKIEVTQVHGHQLPKTKDTVREGDLLDLGTLCDLYGFPDGMMIGPEVVSFCKSKPGDQGWSVAVTGTIVDQ